MNASAFEEKQYNSAYPDGIENHFWNYARNRIILQHLRKIRHGKILDIGCGRGIVTDFLYKNLLDITGVELGQATPIRNAKVKLLYKTNAFDLDKNLKEQISCITLFDVIEHIERPTEFINKLKDHFINCEYFVFTVPARNELWSNYDRFYGHIKRYDTGILLKELGIEKLHVVQYRYFFHALSLYIYLCNRFKIDRKVKLIPPAGIISRLFNMSIGNLFLLESIVMPRRMIGSSLICIAKRN